MALRWLTLVWACVVCGACTAGGEGEGGRGGGSSGTMAHFPTGGASGAGAVGGAAGAGAVGGVGGVSGEAGVGATGGAPQGGVGGIPMDRVFDAGSDPNRNKVMPGALCDRMATIQCAGEWYCCNNPGRDQASCKQTMFQGCMQELFLDVIAADARGGFDAVVAEAAFTEYERLASMCDPNVATWGASTGGLRGIMKGSVAPSGDCAPTGFSITNPTPPSTTEAAIALASCGSIESNACLPGALTWECTGRVGEGGKCFTDVNCQDGLYCDNPNLTITSHECKQRKPAGAGCSLPNECASLACKGGACAALGDVQAAYCLQ